MGPGKQSARVASSRAECLLPQEDPRLDHKAFKPGPSDNIITIASAGATFAPAPISRLEPLQSASFRCLPRCKVTRAHGAGRLQCV